ncbi:FAD-dependent oxidoreductase [bacterium]|nr:FAD-dependent oxidoreductase [bacterium]
MANTYEVIIGGGGMAGCAAAMAAVRSGCRTLLIEQFGYLGGCATAALVNPFMTHCASDGTPLVAGIFDEINRTLDEAGGLLSNCFDTEILMLVLQEMVLGSGAVLRLHTFCDGVSRDDNGDIVVRTVSKSGEETFRCRRLIDCTGDADLAVSLGAEFESGGEDGIPQAATLMFDVGGVDIVRALTYVRDNPDQVRFPKLASDVDLNELADGVVSVAGYYDLVARARNAGEYDAPGDLVFYIGRPRRGEVTFNTTHVGNIDGTNADDLTRAEVDGRRQMISVVRFARKYLPGFENAYLARSAAHVGIRETRRIIGEYKFSGSDVAFARKFDDAICRLAYPVDVHSGKGEGYTKDEEVAGMQAPGPGDWYEIPYRCLIPKGIDGVLIAGRCVSSTQAGHGAIRIMPACTAMGEAAGVAAALSLARGCSPGQVDPVELRAALRQRGALV